MKCDKCKINSASFHSITNINGKVTEKHLCENCAKNEEDFNLTTNSFLDNFMSDFKTSFSYSLDPLLELDFDNFFEDDFFANSFNQNLEKRQKLNDEYKKHLEERERLKKELSEKEKKQLEIKKLDIELKKAVVEERYEDAIVLRDKIKKLKENL
ncbi:MAG: hypothetical protein E7359_04080 [Clostridiales bacterium]|nr:hypothetical protein [Clostridiales bacterium]